MSERPNERGMDMAMSINFDPSCFVIRMENDPAYERLRGMKMSDTLVNDNIDSLT